MVGSIKHIGIALLVLAVIEMSLVLFFDKKIKSSKAEFVKNKEMVSKLDSLSAKWSKSAQKEEFEKALELLGIFGVKYEIKEVRQKRVLSMVLERKNIDKVVSVLVNKNIEIVKLVLKRVDEYSVMLEVEVA